MEPCQTNTECALLLVIVSSSPFQGLHFREALDCVLAAATFEQNVKFVLSHEARFALCQNQSPERIKQKNISKMLSALPIYGVEHVYVLEQENILDGLDHCPLPVRCIDPQQLTSWINKAKTVLCF